MIISAFRMLRISHILLRYRIDEIIFTESPLKKLHVLQYLNPWFYVGNKSDSPAKRVRLTLERLGPIYVKLGQLLSTRRDFIPATIADELAILQDKVPPFPTEKARKIIEKSFGLSINDIFINFDDQPLASASIAQVHCATLKSGEDVVVKVLRPSVKKQIRKDINLLKLLAKFIQKVHPQGERIRPLAIIEQFENSLRNELDLTREAANASSLKRNFENSTELYIPTIYWDYVTPNAFVMERIEGVHIANINKLKKQNTDLKKLSENLIETCFKQVFEDNFFHADMHPGNLFVSYQNKEKIIAVDFGIVGSLTEFDQKYVAENMLAFFKRDYYRVAKLHVDAGWVDKGTSISELEIAIRAVSEPLFEKPLKDISMGHVLLRLIQLAREFRINIQPQLILLQKTFFNVEGVARELNPDLDLWSTAKPYLEKWISRKMGVRALIKGVKEQLPYWIEKFPEMPGLVYAYLNEEQTRTTRTTSHKPKQTYPNNAGIGLGIGLLLSSAIVLPLSISYPAVGWSLFGVGMATFLSSTFLHFYQKAS